MGYFTRNVIKQKKFKNGKIMLVEMKPATLFSIIIYNEKDEIIDSLSNTYFDKSDKNKILAFTKRLYKKKIKEYFYKNP